ncbi:hypothetical protein NL676_034648 [Syzygium grande]|nr:hypothetical protein NL676_034648 [Syzygium grande]
MLILRLQKSLRLIDVIYELLTKISAEVGGKQESAEKKEGATCIGKGLRASDVGKSISISTDHELWKCVSLHINHEEATFDVLLSHQFKQIVRVLLEKTNLKRSSQTHRFPFYRDFSNPKSKETMRITLKATEHTHGTKQTKQGNQGAREEETHRSASGGRGTGGDRDGTDWSLGGGAPLSEAP